MQIETLTAHAESCTAGATDDDEFARLHFKISHGNPPTIKALSLTMSRETLEHMVLVGQRVLRAGAALLPPAANGNVSE